MTPKSKPPTRPISIIRLWPEHHRDEALFDRLLDILRRHRPACDEVWFCTETGFPNMPIHARSADAMARAAAKIRAAGILPGIQIANTIGHSDNPVFPSDSFDGGPFPPVVGPDGNAARVCWCPRSPQVRAYAAEMARLYAAWQPSSVWIDDDLRMNNHSPVRHGCFCDSCLAAFSEKRGRAWDRASLAAALNDPRDGSVRLAWVEFGEESLALLARAIAEAVHAVAPQCRMAFQFCGLDYSLYSGWSGRKIFQAMHNATGLPVGSRPGAGTYTDHRPREIVLKSFLVGRSACLMPDCVDVITSEVENFPHVSTGKTPHGTAVEASLHLAAGCNSASFAAICNNYEPLAWYEQLIERLAAYRPFWDDFLAASAGTFPGGLEVALGRQHVGRPLDPKEAPFSWAAVDLTDVYLTACNGLPLCTAPQGACGAIVHRKTVAGLTDDDLRALVARGALFDGPAACVVQQRGLGELLGMKITPFERTDCLDRLAGDPLPPECRGQIWRWGFVVGRGVSAYSIEPAGTDFREFSFYEDAAGRRVAASAAAAVNSAGGRVAVLGLNPWDNVVSNALRRRLLAVADWVAAGALPVILETPAQVMVVPRVTAAKQCRSLFLLNTSIDHTPPLRLRLRGVTATRALWRIPGKRAQGIPLQPAEDGKTLDLPPLAPWSVGFADLSRSCDLRHHE